MKKKDDKDNKSERFWDSLITGGLFSFEKEWKNSKSFKYTISLFLVPILTTGILILLAIIAFKIVN